MNNHNLLYQYNREIEVSSDSENSYDDELNDERLDISKNEYQIKTYNLIINSTDRDWTGLHKKTFDFQVRFNSSETSTENYDIFTDKNGNQDLINKLYRNIGQRIYNGSKTLSIQENIKNIDSIRINRILLPSRNIYLGNGNFLNILHLKSISLIIDEFNDITYGTNDLLNKSFGIFIPITPLYTESIASKLSSFIEFKNICKEGKTFRPSPLNSLNSLSIKLTDCDGNVLTYQNDILTIKTIEIHSDNKYLKITTNEYFHGENYVEDDIIIFSNIETDNSKLKNYLEDNRGHKIYFEDDYSITKNLSYITTLKNVIYIPNKGDYNLTNGNYIVDSDLESGSLGSISGSILNKNQQILISMELNCKELQNIIFNPEII